MVKTCGPHPSSIAKAAGTRVVDYFNFHARIAASCSAANRIIAAMKSTVPESLWPEIIEDRGRVRTVEPHDHQIVASDADDVGYAPLQFAEMDGED